ncbi:hypothetical protein FRB97_007262 [Tulasnella sp. 331]|nr:hypothetical protein FRB97_007262 [Tulasnella sp. 331]
MVVPTLLCYRSFCLSVTAPSGDIHDYYSLSPYWQPDCSSAHNATELSEEQIEARCQFIQRDGRQLNSSFTSAVNDTGSVAFLMLCHAILILKRKLTFSLIPGAFAALSSAVFYNVLAWRITGQDQYAESAAGFIDAWFLNNATSMNPNLDYAWVIPRESAVTSKRPRSITVGAHGGLLDLHCMTKIVSAIQVLRGAKASSWTSARDGAMNAWASSYVSWLLSSPISLAERATADDHGTFWAAQTASLQVLVGNLTSANDTLQAFLQGAYLDQIDTVGEQPLEASKTPPLHWRAFNLGGIIVINRIAEYIGWDTWNMTTAAYTTAQTAVNYAMALNETGVDVSELSELMPSVAAVASHYGDMNDEYSVWLAQRNPDYPGEAWFFWNQPLSDSGLTVYVDSSGFLTNVAASTNPTNSKEKSGASISRCGLALEMASLNVVIVGGLGKVKPLHFTETDCADKPVGLDLIQISQRLTKLFVSSTPAHRVKSIIRHQNQVDTVKALAPNPTLDLITPIVLSLETSSVQEFTDAFTDSDVVYFIAGAGGKPGEDGKAVDKRTKKVDYEGAVKVFDAVEGVKDGYRRPHLILVSAIDVRDTKKVPDHYNDEDIARSQRGWKAIGTYMHWKYEADKNLSKREGFRWTILRPGGLTEEPGTGKASIGRTHLGSISRDDVAKVLYLLATRPKAAGLAIDLIGGRDDMESQLDEFIAKGVTDFLG